MIIIEQKALIWLSIELKMLVICNFCVVLLYNKKKSWAAGIFLAAECIRVLTKGVTRFSEYYKSSYQYNVHDTGRPYEITSSDAFQFSKPNF